jgi:DNA-binding beta-propeller fold protein YncE
MNLKHLALTVGVCLLNSAAQATFELVLAADETNGIVRRYDGDTGASLGSFGKGHFISPEHIAIDAATGIAYVTDKARRSVSKFNYSTGAFLDEFFIATSGLTTTSMPIRLMNDGNVLVGRDSSLFKLNKDTGTTTGFIGLQNSVLGLAVDSTNTSYVFLSGGGYRKLNSAFGVLVSAPGTDTATGVGAFVGSELIMPMGPINSIRRMNANVAGYPTTLSTMFSGLVISPEAVANGHGKRIYFTSLDAPNSQTILRRSTSPVEIASQVLTIPSVGINGIATVVAPEPGTLLALGAGIGIFVKRKRKTNS